MSITQEDYKRIKELELSVQNLRELFEDVAIIEHALIANGRSYSPYEPTFFLYVFFSFNTLYNTYWPYRDRNKEGDNDKGSEKNRIKSLIDFCFDDDEFVKLFYPLFCDIVTLRANGDAKRITDAMDSIFADGIRIKASDAGDCKAMFNALLTEKGFNSRNMKTLATFIYDVRCNIVHGTKSFQDLRGEKQRERIVYYSFFLIALQQMLFMRLEYFFKHSFSVASEEFINRLRNKQWLSINTPTVSSRNNAIILNQLRNENGHLQELIKAKDENIGTLKLLVKLLEEKVEKLSRK